MGRDLVRGTDGCQRHPFNTSEPSPSMAEGELRHVDSCYRIRIRFAQRTPIRREQDGHAPHPWEFRIRSATLI